MQQLNSLLGPHPNPRQKAGQGEGIGLAPIIFSCKVYPPPWEGLGEDFLPLTLFIANCSL
ncbi:hypothetical protein DHD32_21855 [Arenibacter sp. TNZ]|nr:hypothetical protein [Arenibacter sp. TNZ]